MFCLLADALSVCSQPHRVISGLMVEEDDENKQEELVEPDRRTVLKSLSLSPVFTVDTSASDIYQV